MNNTRTMKISPRLVMSAGAVLAIACSDPVGPCDGRYACQVEGIDIAVLDLEIITANRIGTDPVTMYPVYAPGEVTVTATIVNRGDSTATDIHVWDVTTIPVLEPGETFKAVRTIDISTAALLKEGADARMADVRQVGIGVYVEGDVDTSNNVRESDPFHAAVPVLDGTLAIGGQATELRANAPFVASFSISNLSRHGAALDSTDLVLCMIDYDVGCWWDWPYFGRFELPRVEASSNNANAYLASAPPGATVWPDEAHEAALAICLVPRTLDGTTISTFTMPCVAAVFVTVRPDYSACTPPVAQLGVPLALSAINCQFPDRNEESEYSVISFDAVAGESYGADSGGYQFFTDGDGNRISMPITSSGRYYLVVYHRGPVTVTIFPMDEPSPSRK